MEGAHTASQTILMPDIVLVAEGDKFPGTGEKRLLEVARHTKTDRIEQQRDFNP